MEVEQDNGSRAGLPRQFICLLKKCSLGAYSVPSMDRRPRDTARNMAVKPF